jgi:hypothetical protein
MEITGYLRGKRRAGAGRHCEDLVHREETIVRI